MPLPQSKLLLCSFVVLSVAACHKGTGDKAALPPASPVATVKAPVQETPAPAPAPAPEPGTQVGAASATPAASPTPAAPAAQAAGDENQAADYRLTGQVEAIRRSAIAFRVGGFVGHVVAKPGVVAKKGEVLASLDDRDYALRVELAKAKRDLAKVGLDNAAIEFKRERELKRQNASTPTSFDKMQAAYEQAKINLRLAELDLAVAEDALKDTKLTAPYDSVVATQQHYEGENVQTGTPMFDVYDTAEPEITLTAAERLLGRIKVGSKLTVSVPSAGFSGPAEVVRLVPVIDDKTRTFQVTARLVHYDSRVAPGSYAEATLGD